MQPRMVLFVGNFFLAMSAALTIYVTLPFLSSFMPATYAGLVVALGGLISIAGFPYLPVLVTRYGAQNVALVSAIAEVAGLIGLIIAPNAFIASLGTVVLIALQPFIAYELDVLLEAVTPDAAVTGRVRTLFLTAANVGILSAPLLLGALLDDTNAYARVFMAAALLLIPFIILFARQKLPSGRLPRTSHMEETLVCISRDPDLGSVTFAHLLLRLFYVWAALYTPVYLHTTLGIPWVTLGWMFALMLIPYVLIEYPAGWLADRYLGDKKLLFAGFAIVGAALMALAGTSATSPILLILAILIVSRLGAALIESMTEGHFFRRVSEEDVNSISIFRGIWPLANVLGPVIGSLLLMLGDYRLFFVCTGSLLLVLGIITTTRMRDRAYSSTSV